MTRRIEPVSHGGKAAVRHEAGRVCEAQSCDTQLSIYNGSSLCSVHEAGWGHSQFVPTRGALLTQASERVMPGA